MNIIDFALSKARVFVGILVFIIVSGAATYITIPKESTPDVNIPIIYVSLSQTGISAEDSERLLVKPIEDEVQRSEEHTSEPSHTVISYAVFCLKKKKHKKTLTTKTDKINQYDIRNQYNHI